MRKGKRFSALALVLLILCGLFTGCGSNSEDAVLNFMLAEAPATLDPQLAESATEQMVVRNLFEGLLRADATGNLIPACAERYEQDGSTYRFYLSSDACWSNGDAVTAADFVFAFRRALSPTTAAPFAKELFAIAGAEAYASGSGSLDDLGVRAVDEKTLEITLTQPDRNFLYTLTTAICMPCQEAFFNKAGGRYGLDADNLLTNGSYSLRLWDPQGGEEFRLRLNRSSKYEGNFASQNAAVVFSLGDETQRQKALESGQVDGAYYSDLISSGTTYTGYDQHDFTDTTWVLAIHPSMTEGLRKALLRSIDPNRYSAALGDDAALAGHLIPPDLFPEEALTDFSTHVPAYDPTGAQALFSEAVLSLADKTFPSTTLLYYDTPLMKEIATALAAHWQQNLGAFINIEPVSSLSTLLGTAMSGSYQMVLLPISAGSARNAAPEFFAQCLTGTGLNSVEASSAIADLASQYRTQEEASLGAAVDAVQSAILSTECLYPILYTQTGLALADNLETGLITRYNGSIDFSYVLKTES